MTAGEADLAESDYRTQRRAENREDCSDCGTSDDTCTERVLDTAVACCGSCDWIDTHQKRSPVAAPSPGELDSLLVKVKAAVRYSYEAGDYPDDMEPAVAKYVGGDGGLLNALDDAIAAEERARSAEAEVESLRELLAIAELALGEPGLGDGSHSPSKPCPTTCPCRTG
jgi:hypothetical protein